MPNRTIIALGLAGAALAVEVMQPSEIVSIPLLAVSLFFIAWGLVPDHVRRGVDCCGKAAPTYTQDWTGLTNI